MPEKETKHVTLSIPKEVSDFFDNQAACSVPSTSKKALLEEILKAVYQGLEKKKLKLTRPPQVDGGFVISATR